MVIIRFLIATICRNVGRLPVAFLLLVVAIFGLANSVGFAQASPEFRRVDIVVYGGTPAGIAAAVTAGREGKSVLLVEPYSFVGGMMTNGLSHTDFRTFESITGFYLEVTQLAVRFYENAYGANSSQVQDCWRGTQVEPSVLHAIFQQMLRDSASVSVVLKHRLKAVAVVECCSDGTRHMNSATFVNDEGIDYRVEAKVFIDASYEGDMMAMAKIPYEVGREARARLGESLAPVVADSEVQGYNFRLIVTDRETNRVMPLEPAEYNRADYLDVLPLSLIHI